MRLSGRSRCNQQDRDSLQTLLLDPSSRSAPVHQDVMKGDVGPKQGDNDANGCTGILCRPDHGRVDTDAKDIGHQTRGSNQGSNDHEDEAL